MNQSPGSLPRVSAVFAVWLAITTAGSTIMTGGNAPLEELVTHGLFWPAAAAVAWLFLASVWLGRDAARVSPDWPGALRLLWLPFVFILLFGGLALSSGLPPSETLGWIFLNTLLVGLSEEWMFRGFLFGSLWERFSLWPAVWLSSALFGATHILNTFVTGNFGEGLTQAVAAFLSGVLFCAIRIRTASLWPCILVHWLWDFAVFLQAGHAAEQGTPPEIPWALRVAGPILFVLPNFLYALFLMRRKRRLQVEKP